MGISIGTAEAEPGERADGWLEVTDLPTGGAERLPVTILNSKHEGPTAWVTANMHGNEVTGLAISQDLIARFEHGQVAGALIVIPTLNPAGLRRNVRTSYYHNEDPNRQFPDPQRESARPPTTQELIAERLYERVVGTDPVCLLDLHTAQVGSMPFTIRDRVLYGEQRTEDEAALLAGDLAALTEAVGLPVVTEYPVSEYEERRLHRTLTGALTNAADIPSLTLELGGHERVEPDSLAAGLAAVCRGLVEVGVFTEVPEQVARADPGVEMPVDYRVRRFEGPRTSEAGVVRHYVDAGDVVEAGEPVADVRSLHGERHSRVTSDRDGFVLARYTGGVAYENDPVVSMAVRDEGPLVAARDGDTAE